LIALSDEGDVEVVPRSTEVRFLFVGEIGDVSLPGWSLKDVENSRSFSDRTVLRASIRGGRPCRNGRIGVTAESIDPCLSRIS
jgi:hypothetical protein